MTSRIEAERDRHGELASDRVRDPAEQRPFGVYPGTVISGIGGGAVYATCVGLAVKWFPDRRGFAVGLTAAGYGAGAALTAILSMISAAVSLVAPQKTISLPTLKSDAIGA